MQSVRWEKSNTSDILTRSTVNITDDRILGGTIGDPSITISNVSVADTGYYLFTATNVYGPSYMGFLLNVTLRKWIGLLFFEAIVSMRFFFIDILQLLKKKNKIPYFLSLDLSKIVLF